MKKILASGLAAAALALASCSGSANQTSGQEQSSYNDATHEAATDNPAADGLEHVSRDAVTLENGAVRAKAAKDAADGSDMTSIFGTLRNTSDEDVTVVGFTTSLGQGDNQIHEVVDGVMRQKEGGFDIPAGGTHELAPGGDHFMVMDYAAAIEAGDTVDVTLLLEDGSTATIPNVAVRTMLPGHESYGDHADQVIDGEADHADHASHGEHSH